MEDQVYNRQLKVVAKKMGWTWNVYNKLARFTNTQLLIRYGVPVAVMSKLLGHVKPTSTEVYYNINIKEVLEGLRGIDLKKIRNAKSFNLIIDRQFKRLLPVFIPCKVGLYRFRHPAQRNYPNYLLSRDEN